MLGGMNLKPRHSVAILFVITLVSIRVFIFSYQNEKWIRQEFGKIDVSKTEDKRREEAFSKLELLLPMFPGTPNPKDDENIDGFVEMKETFVRSLQFFWPRDKFKFTGVLDDTAYSNDQERDDLITRFKSYFSDDLAKKVSVKFNPFNNPNLRGWHIQQLIQLWVDNYTDSEYIGYVDDDTLFSSAVYPYDLFDENGRPRIIVRAADDPNNPDPGFLVAPEIMFKKQARFYSMVNFPVIVKREHVMKMREVAMANHPEYSCFDDLFLFLITQSVGQSISQFCILIEYLYENHREEYSWHLEMSEEKQIEFSTPEMYEPFPRISMHGNYIADLDSSEIRYFRTLGGRRAGMAQFMMEGYCYSLLSWNNTNRNADRCKKYGIDDGIHVRGEWKFEWTLSPWLTHEDVSLAHTKRRQHHLTDHIWDEVELNNIFAYADEEIGQADNLNQGS